MKRHNRQKLQQMLDEYRRSGKVKGMKLLSEADVYMLWKAETEAKLQKEKKHRREERKNKWS